MAIDPVCGMEVDEHTSPHHIRKGDQTLYFCGSVCKHTYIKYQQLYFGDLRPDTISAAEQNPSTNHKRS